MPEFVSPVWRKFFRERISINMKLFDLDSPIMRILSRIADLMLLNLMAAICCIPIITAGASFTALHYTALKMARNEETYIIKGFFKSFKDNFKQATIIWLLFLFVLAVLVGDFLIMRNIEAIPNAIRVVVMVVTILVLLTGTFLFPVLAKFDNPVLRTIKNAFVISIMQFPKAIVMFILNWLPWVLLVSVIQIVPLCVFFGFSAPAYASAFMYSKFFKKLEDQIHEKNGDWPVEPEEVPEEEKIFHDKVDESIKINENISR